MANYNLLVISGSLRKESLNTYLAKAFIAQSPADVSIEFASIVDIPLYNEDIASVAFPEPVLKLKEQISSADGIVVITPEYNRAMPGVLKNVLDYTSRPYGQSAWKGKPVFVAGATDGHVGTAVAQHDARAVLLIAGAHVLGQPEFYLGGAKTKFSAEGQLIDEATKGYIDKALSAFIAFVSKFK